MRFMRRDLQGWFDINGRFARIDAPSRRIISIHLPDSCVHIIVSVQADKYACVLA